MRDSSLAQRASRRCGRIGEQLHADPSLPFETTKLGAEQGRVCRPVEIQKHAVARIWTVCQAAEHGEQWRDADPPGDQQ